MKIKHAQLFTFLFFTCTISSVHAFDPEKQDEEIQDLSLHEAIKDSVNQPSYAPISNIVEKKPHLIKQQDEHGNTPFHLLHQVPDAGIFNRLLRGVPTAQALTEIVNIENNEGETAIDLLKLYKDHYATDKEKKECATIIKRLATAGAIDRCQDTSWFQALWTSLGYEKPMCRYFNSDLQKNSKTS